MDPETDSLSSYDDIKGSSSSRQHSQRATGRDYWRKLRLHRKYDPDMISNIDLSTTGEDDIEEMEDPGEKMGEMRRESFKLEVIQKSQKYYLGHQAARVEVIVDRLVQKHSGDVDKALLFVFKDVLSEEKVNVAAIKLLFRGANPTCKDGNGRTPLHHAVKRNYLRIADKLLDHGAIPDVEDDKGITPLSEAINGKQDEMAALILQHMSSKEVRLLFSRNVNHQNPSSYSLHQLIRCSRMDKTVESVLDALIEPDPCNTSQLTLHYRLLDCDEQGISPTEPSFKNHQKSCLQLIAVSSKPEFIGHPVVSRMVHYKWNKFAKLKFLLNGVLYLLFLALLTFCAIAALDVSDPTKYVTPTDISRGVCECLVVATSVYTLFMECLKMKRHKISYAKDPFNFLDLSAILFLLAAVPLRYLHQRTHWGLYSAAYLLCSLRIFKYSALFRSLGAYAKIMWRLISRDYFEFLVMFAVISLAFTGSFSMALRMEGLLSSTNNTETSNFWNVMLTSLRIMVEGDPVLVYYDSSGPIYGWYGTVLFMIYLAVTLVMLLNILIAQLSDTYEKVYGDAQKAVDERRAWIVSRVERNSFTLFNSCTPLRVKYYVDKAEISGSHLKRLQERRGHQCMTDDLDDIDMKLDDIDLSARSIRNRLRQQQATIDKILEELQKLNGTVGANNNAM